MPNPKKPRKKCLNCGIECSRPNCIYCSNTCQRAYQRNQLRYKWYNDVNVPGWAAVRTILFEDRGSKCEVCGIEEWVGKPISLEIDHIDGNHTNNSPNNLRIICPNCHSQTNTYKAKNKGNGRTFRRKNKN